MADVYSSRQTRLRRPPRQCLAYGKHSILVLLVTLEGPSSILIRTLRPFKFAIFSDSLILVTLLVFFFANKLQGRKRSP